MTERFTEYVQNYKDDFEFTPSEQLNYELNGIRIEVKLSMYEDGFNRRIRADVMLQKGDLKYDCECIEANNYADLFTQLTHNGKSYLMFRKTLYGFTLIDPDTL